MASITKRGDKWLVRITRQGQPQTNKTFSAKRDAEAFAATVEGDIARGTYRRNSGDKVTFRTLVERYRDEITITKRGADKERYRLTAMLQPDSAARTLFDKIVSDLHPADVASWRDARLQAVSASTARRDWNILANVLEVARLDWGYSGIDSPFRSIRKPEAHDARDRRISAAELDAIVTETQSAELGAFVRLAVETCARRSELLSLQWRNIDLGRCTAKLGRQCTKNGEGRTLPLSPAAVSILQELPRRIDGRVFALRPNSVSQAFRRAVDRARASYKARCGAAADPEFLVGVRLHDARHEGVSRLAERGWSSLEVAAVSGHKTLQLLARYTHLSAENLAEKLAARSGG